MPILHAATCDNYFIVKCLLKSNESIDILLTNCIEFAQYNLMLTWFKSTEAKTAGTTLPGHILYFLTALFFHISIRIFCTLFICLVFDGLLQLIYFRMFCSKHSITFENMYLLSCWFYCAYIFYIKFRFRETYTVTSSMTRNLLIETLSNFRTIKYWFNG